MINPIVFVYVLASKATKYNDPKTKRIHVKEDSIISRDFFCGESTEDTAFEIVTVGPVAGQLCEACKAKLLPSTQPNQRTHKRKNRTMARKALYPVSSLSLLSDLNPEQFKAASHANGPMVILAQAGSGKTKTLISLVGNLSQTFDPTRILAVTFSKKAADEMQERGRKFSLKAKFSTWHAFALSVLKEDKTEQSTWNVDESDRAKYAIKDALGYRYLDWKAADISKVRQFITHCKANGLFPSDTKEVAELAAKHFTKPGDQSKAREAYKISQSIIENQGLLTFDDFLVFCLKYLEQEENRQRWASKFDWVLQDEAQDANSVQTKIAVLLTKESRNYVVVGDCGQSIYGFRGSSPQTIVDFEKLNPGCQVVTMNRNYRSCPEVVNVANKIIAPAKVRLPTDMIAERRTPGMARALSATDFDDEAREFVSYVNATYQEGGKYSDVTCLFRTNAQSRALEEALLSAKIPYLILGGTSFYERKEVKDLLGYLRVANGEKNEQALRCINAPFRYLGNAFIEGVSQALLRGASDVTEAVQMATQRTGIQARQRAAVSEWLQIVNGAKAQIEDHNPSSILNWVVSQTKFIEWLTKDEGEESIESSHAANVRELIRVSTSFSKTSEFLAYVDRSIKAAAAQRKDQASGGDRVLLMSIHRSKGLEWPKVWVVGLNENLLPHKFGDPEEERRLAYVAATRARDELTLSYVKQFATAEGMKVANPSPFLIDAGLVFQESQTDKIRGELFAAQLEAKYGSIKRPFVRGKQLDRVPGG